MISLLLACVDPSTPAGLDSATTESVPTGSTPTNPTDSTPTNTTPTEDPDDRDGDGHPAVGADCDDHDPSVYIGATEVPGDGVDQNCDGLDGAPAVTLSDFAAGDWTTTRYDELCMATYSGALIVDDVTGDGGRDVLVGIPGSGDAETAVDCEGAVILQGPAFDRGDMTIQWARWGEWWHATGGEGVRVAGVPDATGDGVADIAVGVTQRVATDGGAGGGAVVFAPATAPGTFDLGGDALTITGSSAHSVAAFPVGLDHVLEDAPSGVAIAGLDRSGAPASWLFSLPLAGNSETDFSESSTAQVHSAIQDLTGDGLRDALAAHPDGASVCVIPGPITPDSKPEEPCVTGVSGSRLVAADTNSDGYADLLVGTDQNDSTYTTGGGRAGVFFGPIVGDHAVRDADMIIAPESAGKALGYAVALGDFDADGDADLALGAPMGGTGAVVLFRDVGPGVYSTADADLVLAGGLLGDYAGYGLSTGDLDVDGHDDLAVAAPYDSSVVAAGGRLYLVSGADVAARW